MITGPAILRRLTFHASDDDTPKPAPVVSRHLIVALAQRFLATNRRGAQAPFKGLKHHRPCRLFLAFTATPWPAVRSVLSLVPEPPWAADVAKNLAFAERT